MSYLDKLKAEFPENGSQDALTKLTKATNSGIAPPSVSYVSTPCDRFPANDGAGQDDKLTLEPAGMAELRALVDLIADHHAFTPAQRAEAQQIAQADQVAALECFRSLAERDGLTVH